MIQRIVLFFTLLCSFTFVHAQKFILNSDWRDSAMVIDGSPADWVQPYHYFDSKSKLQYSVVNDAKYIYVSVRTSDDKAQMKIMRAGMDVSFDVSGKKKEISTVHFPQKTNSKLDISNDSGEPDQQVIERPDQKKMRMEWTESMKEVKLQGFRGVPERFNMIDTNRQAIEVAVEWEHDYTMTYELKVPFSTFYKDALVAADTQKPITINIKVNAMDLPLIPTNASTNTDMTGITNNGMNQTTNGMPNNINNNQRPQTSTPQPSMVIPKSVADMGQPLIVTMKIKLAYR